MKPETKLWVEDADYDRESAKAMLESKRYFFVVFMCHLTIEKLLKAAIIERLGIEPPKIHSLIGLATRATLSIPTGHQKLIHELDDMGVVTRYPDGRRALASTLTPERSTNLYERTRKFAQWLKRELK
ncbi:MAG: HEPN domain-containing protein [Phycisphaerae bacterium]